jgi:hypothetical protein
MQVAGKGSLVPCPVMTPELIAMLVACVLLGIITFFQLALAFGVPWGSAAWGGRHPGRLPGRLRLASAVAALVIYPAIGLSIIITASPVQVRPVPGTGEVWMWVFAGLFTLGAIANFASRSKPERIWGPVSLIIAICCAVIAVNV